MRSIVRWIKERAGGRTMPLEANPGRVPTRVLHVFASLDRGGAEQVVMTWFRNLDGNQVQFDFLVNARESPYAHEMEIMEGGGRVFKIPAPSLDLISYMVRWGRLLHRHPEWSVVHVHHTSPAVLFVPLARLAGRRVIVHSHIAHDTGSFKSLMKRVSRAPLRYLGNDLVACSEAAGQWMFGGKSFRVIANAIDVEKYEFDLVVRERVRDEQHWGNSPILIHAGRFAEQKNHQFLLQVAAELIKTRHPDALLVLLGEGPLRGEIEVLANSLGVGNSVVFLGSVEEVSTILTAGDVFVLPSLFEGLPVALVEAQASGLPCVISDAVSAEALLTANVERLALSAGVPAWVESISRALETANLRRRALPSSLRNSKWDASSSTSDILRVYSAGTHTGEIGSI